MRWYIIKIIDNWKYGFDTSKRSWMKIAVTAPRIIAKLQDSYMLGSIIQISYILIHHFESVRQAQTCMNNSYCILLTKNGKMCSIQMPFKKKRWWREARTRRVGSMYLLSQEKENCGRSGLLPSAVRTLVGVPTTVEFVNSTFVNAISSPIWLHAQIRNVSDDDSNLTPFHLFSWITQKIRT